MTWSGNNPEADPLFATPSYRLQCGSPCINVGNTDPSVIPADIYNLDGDTDYSEPTPDLDFINRILFGQVDMGAYEIGWCRADVNGDGVVNVTDLLAVINQWSGLPGSPACPCSADVAPGPCAGDGVVNVSDLLLVINQWGNDCNNFGIRNVGSLSSVQDCMNWCGQHYSGQEWNDCVNKCVQGLCDAGVLPPEECP